MNREDKVSDFDSAISVATAESVVSVRGLVKRYGRREAVRGIDLEVHRGEIFAFLGPNGAGRTTTVDILEATQIDGHDNNEPPAPTP